MVVTKKRGRPKEHKPYGTFSSSITKNINGVPTKYIKVVIRNSKKTVTKQYRYRGGEQRIYEREAKIPKGTKYLIDYSKGRIIRSATQIEKLLKQVKPRKGVKRRKTTTKSVPIPKVPKYELIQKRVRHPPKPVQAEKIVKMMDGKVFYEREHSIFDFSSKVKEDKFLLDVLKKATKKKSYATKLLQNFDKIKLKMSYLVVIEGLNEQGKKTEVGHFTAVGQRPTEVTHAIQEAGLAPTGEIIEVSYDANIQGISKDQQYIKSGRYRITDVKIIVKFFNNPQYGLGKYR